MTAKENGTKQKVSEIKEGSQGKDLSQSTIEVIVQQNINTKTNTCPVFYMIQVWQTIRFKLSH
jgi:hypothetical protein